MQLVNSRYAPVGPLNANYGWVDNPIVQQGGYSFAAWLRRRLAREARERFMNRGGDYEEPPAPTWGPPSKRFPTAAKYKANRSGTSWYGRTHKGPFYRPSALLYKGIQLDLQESVTNSVSRVQYFGHYTHPHRAVIAAICAALAKQLGWMACKDTPSSLQKRFCTDVMTHIPGYRIELRYRNEPSDTATFTFVATNVPDTTTYMGVAVIIRDLFYQVFANTANTQDVYLDSLILQGYDETVAANGAIKVAPVVIRLSDVSVMVDGTSRLKYQNVTLSDAAGTGDTHDVENNPLEGIEYNFKGSKNALRHATQAASQGVLTHSGNSGIGYFDSAVFADGTVDTILESRPNPRVWSTRTTSRSVRMQPGVLSTSVIRRVHTMNIQRWFKGYSRALQSTAAADTGSAEKSSLGVSRWFAVDKMIHDSGDGNTIVNLEIELKLKAKIIIKRRKTPTAPYNALT